MSRNRILPVVAFVLVGLCGYAGADTKTFQPSRGDWNNQANWSPQGVPTGTTRVIIPAGRICNVNVDATADTVVVQSIGGNDGELTIDAGETLTLENNTDNVPAFGPFTPDHSIVDGVLVLEYNGSTGQSGVLSFVASSNHVVSGTGTILGGGAEYGAGCEIRIAATKKFTNQLAAFGKGIRGGLRIVGQTQSGQTNGTFRNEGYVKANGLMILEDTTILEDIDGARWVANCKDVMVFRREALALLGDFEHNTDDGSGGFGTFEFEQTIKTCGAYKRLACGCADVWPDASFQYAEFVSSHCSNPGIGGGTCNDPFVITEDEEVTGCSCAS